MAGSRNPRFSLNNSQKVSRSTHSRVQRFAYVGLIPILAALLLVAMFGLMGALPGLVEAQANTWFVTETGTGNTCSANNPCALTTAVTNAAAGDEIRVAEGVYTATTAITLSQAISLTGGYIYSGGGVWSAEPDVNNVTTLNGQNARRVLYVAANASPAIANFHIINGAANNGAGIYVAAGNGRPLITTNVISNNLASLGGGGIYDGAAAVIENNEILNNRASGGGGGAGILVDNSSATLSTTIRFNQIHNNQGTGSNSYGGGIFHATGAKALLVGNTIHNNTGRVGGGIGAFLNTQITLFSNMIYDNTANSGTVPFGGGLSIAGQATIWNNTFIGNSASSGGAGIFLDDAATARISNNIVAFNTGNGNDGIDYSGSQPALITGGYNNVHDDAVDAALTLSNPVTGNPDFVSLAARNLHINSSSPALNAGDPSTPAWVNIDIDQQARPNPAAGFDTQDVGADEYYANFAAFELTPAVTNNIVDRGAVEIFTHTVRNVGTVADRYDIECGSNIFTVTVCASETVTVAAGSTTQIQTSVTIPTDLVPYQVGNTTITATSQVSDTLMETAVVRSTIALRPGIEFTPHISRTELPGEVFTLTHVITNTGDAFDSFTITKIEDTNNWATLLPQNPLTVSLNAGVAQNVRVQIQIPPYAPQGLANVVRLEAVSNFDPDITATVVETITAKATTGTRFVKTTGTDQDNNCTQPNKPCLTVGHAIGQVAAGDEVRIAPGVYQESDIDINDTIHISGGWRSFADNGQGEEPDATLTVIDANNTGQIFVVGAGRSTVSDLTLSRGFASNGGAVFISSPSQINFENVIFENNVASNRGGAVYMNSGTAVSVKDSFFTNNHSSLGGGGFYMNGGTLSLNQSRFLTNTATSAAASSGGGGLGMNSGVLYAQNNLFYNNVATSSGGGVRLNGGVATFNFNTWVENGAGGSGGGLYNHGANADIQNSIFADNSGNNGSALSENNSGATTTFDYLLFSLGQTTNVSGSFIEADPLFGDEEFRLGLGSPAIDAANPNSTLAVDFENDFRPSDEGFDIGYDERAGCRTKRDDTIYGSIQDAVDVDDAESDLIRVSGICRGVHPLEVGGSVISQTVHLTKSLVIEGGWNGDFSRRTMDATIVDPEGRGRGFLVTDGVSVTIAAISVTNGVAIDLGGIEPITGGAGGGVYNVDGDLTLRGVTIVSGTAVTGAGFYNEGGSALLTWEMVEGDPDRYFLTQIATNTADTGAGFATGDGDLTLDGVWLYGNQARLGGGGLHQGGVITVVNSIFDQNQASENGGGFYNAAITATLAHNTFYSNTAVSGGGVYDEAGSLLVESSIFESNQAPDGSAIFAEVTSTVADFNYYYANSGTAVSGTDAGADSITSATPPGLADPAAGDFHLEEEAPAADRGNPASFVTRDFEDDPRPSNQGFDMGADEVVGCLVKLNDVIYGSLQAAIDDAQPGDEILVSGTCSGVHAFTPGSGSGAACSGAGIQTAVHLTKSVNLSGGWNDAFRQQEGHSVLDAKNQGRVMYIGPGVTSTIDGFELINGLLSGPQANGAGICIDQAAPTIQNNRIYSNTAADDGGGIYSLNSQPALQGGNHIYNNEAINGGGLYIHVASGQVYTNSVVNNFIYFNQATNGGGFYADRGIHNIWHNTVVSNTASSQGGGFYMSADASGPADMRGLIIMGNTAASGGGVFGAGSTSPALSHNNYYQNNPGNFGGTAVDNSATSLAVDPQFSNPISGVFTITIASPVVDVEIPDMPLAVDYEGDIRPSHQGYDLGADEVGGCFAIIAGSPETVYGSVQLAVDMAAAGDTILVDGVCRNVNSRQVGGQTVLQTLLLTKSVTIDGSWEYPADTSTVTTTLDALNRGRVLYVAPGVTVTVTNILLENGTAVGAGNGDNGGGVYNAGTLNLLTAWVQNSTAVSGAGLYNAGDLMMAETAVLTNTAQQDGGGLYNNGPATISGSEFRANFMGRNGGALYQQGGALMVDGNRLHHGGSSAASSSGGAVYLNSGAADVDIRNNFIYQNGAETGGGLYNANTNGRLWHNTFVINAADGGLGGGIATLGGSPDIRNNIVDQNIGSGIYARGGASLIDYNLVYNTLGYPNIDAAGGATVGSHNITTSGADYVDPFEENFHLRQDSPGEDAGDPFISDELTNSNAVLIDYDGDTRPTNSGPDMGADEINSCLVKVGNQIFTVLQNAIDYAEAQDIPDVYIARGECRGVMEKNGTLQVAYISENLNLVGSLRRSDFSAPNPPDYDSDEVGRNSSIINAVGEGRAVYIANSAVVSFTHLAFVNGNAFATDTSSDHGGAIYNGNGSAGFSQVYICQSGAQDGGGYYSTPGALTDMTGTTIGRCTVAQVTETPNGAVSEVRYKGFLGNAAARNGGGLFFGGEADLRNMGIMFNFAGQSGVGSGGGLYNNGADTRIVNGIFYSNTVPNNGGAVYNNANNLRLLHNTIRQNVAGGQGGGVYNGNSGFELNSSIIYENSAGTANGGGGLYSTNGGSLTYNNFNANVPNDSSVGPGTPTIVGDPGLLGIYILSVNSRNIDAANPALLSEVDFDAGMFDRPDGFDLPYVSPRGIYADVGAFEYRMDFGCEIDPASETRRATPGETLTYTLSIINTGNPPYTGSTPWLSDGYTDTITITVASQAQGWATFEGGEVQTVELGWQDYYPQGETTTRVLTITVPLTATVGMNEVVNLRCDSASLPLSNRGGNATITAEIGDRTGVDVVPNYFLTAVPGQVISRPQTVINLSNDIQTYRLTPSSGPRHANAVLLDSDTFSPTNAITVTLAPSGTVGFTTTTYLEMTILDTATAGDIATPSVIATDIDDPQVFGANRNEITILAAPGTRYVATAADGGVDNTNCTDPLLPCATIQHAINQAVAGDEILVAKGIYRHFTVQTVGSDELHQNVFVDKPVTIRGGFDSGDGYTVQAPITNTVILDGEGLRRVIYVAAGVDATLSGLFIENGAAGQGNLSINGSTRDYGSGVYNVNGNLTITATWILTNEARFGGGVYHTNGDLTLNNSVFADNTNENPSGELGVGAGLFISDGVALLENNTFVNNQAINGGDSVLVGEGSAIYQEAGSTMLVNQIFQDNEAAGGAAQYAVYVTGTAVLTPAYNLYYSQTNPINVGLGVGARSGDADFIDATYHIGPNSDALDQGTTSSAYLRPEILTSGDFDLEERVQGATIDIGADERTQKPGFVFVPPSRAAVIDAGQTITYQHWLTNTGDFVDSYTLTMTNQVIPAGDATWSRHFYPDTITNLGLGEAVTVTVVITGGQPGFQDITTIEAVSASGLSRSVVDTTTISQTAGVEIAPSDAQIGLPGQWVTYSHTLTNTGNGVDQFELMATAVPTSWITAVSPTQTGSLPSLATMPFTVTVFVPADALSSTHHVLTVTAVATNPDASDTLTDTTTVGLVSGLTLAPDWTRSVPDGQSTVYSHTLTSGSNVTDTVNLTVVGSLPGWGEMVEPTAVTLSPFESRIISVTVTTPPNSGGLTHVAQVTATSSLPALSASATDTTTVPVETGLLFTPNHSRIVNAGATQVYTHTLTNQGNLTDTFALTSNSSQGWLDSLTPDPLVVAPGTSVPVTAVVSVPLGATPATEDILTITATSQSDTATTGTVTDTTRVAQRHELAFFPDRSGVADAGTMKVYTHTLENLGDGVDSFILSASGAPNWPLTLPPTPITLNSRQSTTVMVTLTVPSGASGLTNVSHITATSTISPAFSAMVTDTTQVSGTVAVLGVDIEPDGFRVAQPGQTVTHYHTVTNTGSGPDDIGLSLVSGWAAAIEPAQVTLASGASAPVTVTVTIPAGAGPGEEDVALVTAVSLSDPGVNDSVTDTTRAVQTHGLEFFPDQAQTAAAGSTVVYSHTLRNTGNGSDTFALTPVSAWSAAVDSPVTLAAQAETTVFVTLTIPFGAAGQVDVMQISASSLISPAFSALVTDTTTVSGTTPVADVQIGPDHTDYGVGGESIQYVHIVTNTGETAATFNLEAVSSLRWLPDVTPLTLNLAAGDSGLVTVTVMIPAGANVGTRDVTTVTVTAQTDATITDSALDTTIVPGVFLPVVMKAPAGGGTPTPTPIPTVTYTPSPTPPACTTPTGKDLVVTQIRVEPAAPVAGQTAVVFVTIRNQGPVSVDPSNNFYADFYVDRVPARYLIGDIEWPVQGEWMGAGQSYTLSRSFIFRSGAHQLWAQVDTDDTVDECPFEGNNVRGPIPLTVIGAVDGSDGNQPLPLLPNEGPRSTPTPIREERPLSTPTPTPTSTVTPPAVNKN